jgi:hypothetical protein
MLQARAVDCIRESVEAELGPRGTNLAAAVNACDSEFAWAGRINSSSRVYKRGVIACQELTVRAEIIWGIIQQCRRLFGRLASMSPVPSNRTEPELYFLPRARPGLTAVSL